MNYRLAKPFLILFVLLAAIGLLELTNVTHLFHHKKRAQPPTANSETKGEVAAQRGQNTPTTSPQQGQDKQASGSTDSNQVLFEPSGNFVSNHHPNLDGSPAPNLMSSDCTTSPGATCTISFTKGGATKSLPAKTADAGGTAYWNWKLQDYGLTQGKWTIKATATLGSQSKTAADAQPLEVAE